MKQMQDFRARLSATHKAPTRHQRRMAALTRLSREQVNSFATLDLWFVWSSQSAAEAR